MPLQSDAMNDPIRFVGHWRAQQVVSGQPFMENPVSKQCRL